MDEAKYPNNLCEHRPASSIVKHLIESGYRIDISEAFNILSKSSKDNVFRFIKALVIRNFNRDSISLSTYNCPSGMGIHLLLLTFWWLVNNLAFWWSTLMAYFKSSFIF